MFPFLEEFSTEKTKTPLRYRRHFYGKDTKFLNEKVREKGKDPIFNERKKWTHFQQRYEGKSVFLLKSTKQSAPFFN